MCESACVRESMRVCARGGERGGDFKNEQELARQRVKFQLCQKRLTRWILYVLLKPGEFVAGNVVGNAVVACSP